MVLPGVKVALPWNNQQNRAGQDTGYHDYNHISSKIANEIAHLLSFFQRGCVVLDDAP
jgi:hypothetical protein